MAGITFASPLETVQNSDYISQIPLDMLFKNMSYKQAQFDQDVQNTVHNLQSIDKIQGSFPQDQQRSQELKAQLNSALAELGKGNLNHNNAKTQINNLISQISSEMTPIQIRANQLATIKKERQEASKKGVNYFNPAEDEIMDYHKSEKYDPNKVFNSQSMFLPSTAELMKQIKDNTQPDEKTVYDSVNHQWVTTKTYDPDKLAQTAKNIIGSNSDLQKFYNHQREKGLKNNEWDQPEYSTGYDKYKRIVEEANQNPSLDNAVVLAYAKSELNKEDPNNRYQNYYNQFLDKKINDLIYPLVSQQETERKLDEIHKMQIQSKLDIQEVRAKVRAELGLTSNASDKDVQDALVKKQHREAGTDLTFVEAEKTLEKIKAGNTTDADVQKLKYYEEPNVADPTKMDKKQGMIVKVSGPSGTSSGRVVVIPKHTKGEYDDYKVDGTDRYDYNKLKRAGLIKNEFSDVNSIIAVTNETASKIKTNTSSTTTTNQNDQLKDLGL